VLHNMVNKRNIATEIKEGLLETLDFVQGKNTKSRITSFYIDQKDTSETNKKTHDQTSNEFSE